MLCSDLGGGGKQGRSFIIKRFPLNLPFSPKREKEEVRRHKRKIVTL
jgi:hypothetical protein